LERLILTNWQIPFEAVGPNWWPPSLKELTLHCERPDEAEEFVGLFEDLPSLASLKIVHEVTKQITWTRSDGKLIKTEGHLPNPPPKHFRRFQHLKVIASLLWLTTVFRIES
jgi:hypothetical protein